MGQKYINKKPELSHEEVLIEIQNRTGYSATSIYKIMRNYIDILEESILSGVEVRIPNIGVLTWKVKAPHKNVVVWNPRLQTFSEPHDSPGFFVPHLRISKTFKAKLKEITLYEGPKEEKEEEKENE